MGVTFDLEPAIAALDDAVAALDRLERTCCVPSRSPRMEALGDTIAEIRASLDRFASAPEAGARAASLLEEAGGQVGSLQIGCCAPDRLPLYARMLEDLTTVRLALDAARGLAH